MDLKELNKPVNIDDIDFRIQSINSNGWATILAYKDARYDMNVLDDVVGAENWQKDYKIINERLYCGVAIKCNNEWVWKWDVGTESQTEKEKGQASDAFKRSCFNWGIGRELYEFPYIGVQLNEAEYYLKDVGNKKIGVAKVRINDWKWHIDRENDKIIWMGCRDGNKKLRWQTGDYSKMKEKLNNG